MYFYLVPDALSGTQVRRVLAQHHAVDVKVGTFETLLDTLMEYWLLPEPEHNFESELAQQITLMDGVFWQQSAQVDLKGSIVAIENALLQLLEGLPLTQQLPKPDCTSRVARYYHDLVKLHRQMGNMRPTQQARALTWLQASETTPLAPLSLLYHSDNFAFSAWQQEIVDQLATLNCTNDDAQQQKIMALVDSLVEPKQRAKDEFAFISDHLFKHQRPTALPPRDATTVVACRDDLQQAEVIAGSIVKAMNESAVSAEHIAVMLPLHSPLQDDLARLLRNAGIPITNWKDKSRYQRWDSQLLKDCLIHYRECLLSGAGYAPMSLAAILTNPLMPWSAFQGQNFAEHIFSGRLSQLQSEDADSGVLLESILQADKIPLHTWLDNIVNHCRFPADNRIVSKQRMVELINELDVAAGCNIDEQFLTQHINEMSIQSVSIEHDDERYFLNSVTLLSENEYLLTSPKRLYVAGFNEGAYEGLASSSKIFLDEEWHQLSDLTGLHFHQQLTFKGHNLSILAQNIGRVSEQLVVTLSNRDFEGRPILPSASLLDLALCFQAAEKVEPSAIIENIDVLAGVSDIIAVTEVETPPVSREKNAPEDLHFGCDLFAKNVKSDGSQRTESPSSLDKLMTSPLAWLLDRQGLKQSHWPPLQLEIWRQGNVAHRVLELHFDPSRKESLDCFDTLFERAMLDEAAFLANPAWKAERMLLRNDIYSAVMPFVQWCSANNWQAVHTEHELKGELWGLSIRGFADVIFETPDGLFVMDYKKTKSDGRLQRLEQGYDLQTFLYSTLLSKLNISNTANTSVKSGYFTLNDNTIVTQNVSFSHEHGITLQSPSVDSHEQSRRAIEDVQQRIEQIRAGVIELNTTADIKEWKKKGVTLEYTYQDFPIISRYLKESGDE